MSIFNSFLDFCISNAHIGIKNKLPIPTYVIEKLKA